MISLGADHGGFEVKKKVKEWLNRWHFKFEDLGNLVFERNDDYPDFASRVAQKVSQGKNDFGILICRSGHGMDMVANKFPGVRSALCFSLKHAKQSRQHEDANVLCLANDYLKEAEIKKIIRVFLETEFSGKERHKKRLGKIKKLEQENFTR